MNRYNKIIGCMVIYNEAEYLERAIRSLILVADQIIIVDGPYINYPHASASSDDGSLDIVRKYQDAGAPITLVTRETAWPDQMTKRNEYFKYGDIGDLMLILDGDCQVVVTDDGMKRLRLSDADCFQASDVRLAHAQDGNLQAVKIRWGNPYILRKCVGMHYALNHFDL